jgi:hypothetical protein
MVRALLRVVVVVVVLVAAAAFFFGYRWADGDAVDVVDRPVGTVGDIDTSRAREAGAEIGERVAAGASTAERAVADASLTTKIKSKMALDDYVKAIDIDVDTRGTIVTLTGRVGSETERQRALQLARETEGVTEVVDRLTVAR